MVDPQIIAPEMGKRRADKRNHFRVAECNCRSRLPFCSSAHLVGFRGYAGTRQAKAIEDMEYAARRV